MNFWLFQRLIIRRLFYSPLRLGLLVAALSLSTSLWLAVSAVVISGVQSFEESVGLGSREYPLVVTAASGRFRLSDFISCLAPLTNEFQIVAIRRELGSFDKASKTRGVRIVGVAATESDHSQVSKNNSVRWARMDVGTKKLLGYRDGDAFAFSIAGKFLEGAVVVPFDTESRELFQSESALATVVVPLELLQNVEPRNVVDAFLLKTKGKRDIEQSRSSVRKWFEDCSNEGALGGKIAIRAETPNIRVENGENLLRAYRMNVSVLAVITLLVCAILISHAAQLSLVSMSRELSIVRTLGVTKTWCGLAIVGESGVIGALGALIGITVGYPITSRLTEFLLDTANNVYRVNLSSEITGFNPLTIQFLVGLLVTLTSVAGSLFAFFRARKVSTGLGTRRESAQVKSISLTSAITMSTLCSGFLFFSWSAVEQTMRTGVNNISWAYLFVSIGMAWSIMAVPLFFSLTLLCLRRIVLRISPVSGRLACGNVSSFAGGHILGVMAIATAVSLLVAVSLMVGSFRSTLLSWAEQRLRGDLFVSIDTGTNKGPESKIADAVALRLSHIAGVVEIRSYKETTSTVKGAQIKVGGVDVRKHLRDNAYRFVSVHPSYSTFVPKSMALISESGAAKLKVSEGSEITIDGHAVSIAGVIQEFSTEQPLVVVDIGEFDEWYPGQGADTLTVSTESAIATEKIRAAMESVLGPAATVRDQKQLRDLVMEMFERTFRITGSVRWIVFLIAGIGLVVSFLQHLWERRRELKTMQVLGVDRSQLIAGLAWESVIVVLSAGPVGIIGGWIVGWGLVRYVNPLSFGWSLDFDPTLMPLITSIAFLLCLSACITVVSWLTLGKILGSARLADE